MDDSGVVIRRITRRQPEAGEEVRLTPTEWHLLEVLLRSPGRLLSRQQILAAVWEPGYDRATGSPRDTSARPERGHRCRAAPPRVTRLA
jgi:hypothetical protein